MENINRAVLWGVKASHKTSDSGGYEEIAYFSGLHGDEPLQFYSFHELASYLHWNLNIVNNAYIAELEKSCDLNLLCEYVNRFLDTDGLLEYYRKVSEFIVPGAVFLTKEEAEAFIANSVLSDSAYPYEMEVNADYSRSLSELIIRAKEQNHVRGDN